MKILLSIKPEFAHKIFDGTKQFEFRKSLFKREDIRKVIVYSSHPDQKVIGEFEIEKVLKEKPERIWEQTKNSSGINKEYFMKYFKGKDVGYAIQIKNPVLFETTLSLQEDFGIKNPPQSFCYLDVSEELASL